MKGDTDRYSIKAQVVDIENRRVFPGEVFVTGSVIEDILEVDDAPDHFILPGFIDAHIHIESSMLVPYEFARIALRHGTVATVSDPHEIANVLGMEGVDYMIENSRNAKLKFHFGAPSCVPATEFESAGAVLDTEAVAKLLARDNIYYLSEMMNYPGVLQGDESVLAKLEAGRKAGKPVDGHAPGLRGDDARTYCAAGITTDHECFTLEEAQEKADLGMKIIIREGSAAKNFDALHPIIGKYPVQTMFCSDDKHPDDLLLGHIDALVRRAIGLGYDLWDVLQIACINPKYHYALTSGILRIGDPADFIIVNNLSEFDVMTTYIDGQKVADKDQVFLSDQEHPLINQFNTGKKSVSDFKLKVKDEPIKYPVIVAVDGSLITEKAFVRLPVMEGELCADPAQDILKITVVNRYQDTPPAIGFIKNFGLTSGAIGSTVAHDSHNIIVVGVDDKSIAQAVNRLIDSTGGLIAVSDDYEMHLPLPIGGLMSDLKGEEVAQAYSEIDAFAKSLGCSLTSPFMTLSFMALLFIPKIKLSDRGLFDAESFTFYQ